MTSSIPQIPSALPSPSSADAAAPPAVSLNEKSFPARKLPPLWANLLGAVLGVAAMALLRLVIVSDRIVPIGYGIPLLVFVWLGNRRVLWATAIACWIISLLEIFWVLPDRNGFWRSHVSYHYVAAGLVILEILTLTLLVHWTINARRTMLLHNHQLELRDTALQHLLNLSRSMVSDTEPSEVVQRVCDTLLQLLGTDHSTVLLVQHQPQHESQHQAQHQAQRQVQRQAQSSPSEQCAVVARCGDSIADEIAIEFSYRAISQSRTISSSSRAGSALTTPLRARDGFVGTLGIYQPAHREWSSNDIAIVESLAAQASTSLASAQSFERLEQEQLRLQAVLDNMPIGILITRGAWPGLTCNQKGAALLNVSADVLLSGIELATRVRFEKEGQPLTLEQWPIRRAQLLGEQIIDQELVMQRPGDLPGNSSGNSPGNESGRESGRDVCVVLTSAAPIVDSAGRRVGAVCTISDITAAKIAHRDLEQRRLEAEEASQRKSRFLAAVSHDIRTPTNAISLLAELIQRTASMPGSIAEVPEIATDLKRSAITLVDLVSDVLDLTRFDSVGIELHETEFDLGEMVQEECKALVPLAREKSLTLDVILPPVKAAGELIRVRLDRVKLSRVLVNLVSNAIKFTDRGGVRVRVEAERPADTHDGDSPAPGIGASGIGASGIGASGVRISVSDSGQGIAAENHERIFDEFQQLRVHGTDSSSGSGLGLAICRRLIHAMGGTISLESNPGLGSTFAIQLPATVVVAEAHS